jgi:colicin import membrane protein
MNKPTQRMIQDERESTLQRLKFALTKGRRRFLYGSIAVHSFFFLLLLGSWDGFSQTETLVLPNSIQATVLSQEDINRLPYKKRQKAQEAAKAEAKQKALEKKKSLDKKQKAQALAKKRAEKEKEQALEAEKRAAEKKKKLAVKREAEQQKLLAQKKLAEKVAQERRAKQAAAARAKQVDAQAKSKDQADRLSRLAAQRATQQAVPQTTEPVASKSETATIDSSEQASLSASEIERYFSNIKGKIEQRWKVPPRSLGRSLLLRIRLLPSGELDEVEILQGSGSEPLDQSALAAVRKIEKFAVPGQRSLFDKYFRSFQMSFKPEE